MKGMAFRALLYFIDCLPVYVDLVCCLFAQGETRYGRLSLAYMLVVEILSLIWLINFIQYAPFLSFCNDLFKIAMVNYGDDISFSSVASC
jgi:hypothetical protein